MLKLVIAVYSHPEYLPPTLNAINELSKKFSEVYILYRHYLVNSWSYPNNVYLKTSGALIDVRDAEKKNTLWKFLNFINFTSKFLTLAITKSPNIILVYDPIPLFAFYLIRIFTNKKIKVWYHNHDVGEITNTRKYSIGWFALKNEHKMFKYLDIFSIPAIERKYYFPMNEFKGQFFYLPNFPSKKLYSKFYKPKSIVISPVKLIFQGSIGNGHGFEEIISILNETIVDKELNLILKGFISDEYKNYLILLAKEYNVSDKLFFYEVGSYESVPELASTCHIGIGIHTKTDIMNKTLGTSSNKIYEYAAVGLPVLLYDNEHFRKHLGQYEWAFFTDLTKNSLLNCIKNIVKDYTRFSYSAKKDFDENLNYEKNFKPILSKLIVSIF